MAELLFQDKPSIQHANIRFGGPKVKEKYFCMNASGYHLPKPIDEEDLAVLIMRSRNCPVPDMIEKCFVKRSPQKHDG